VTEPTRTSLVGSVTGSVTGLNRFCTHNYYISNNILFIILLHTKNMPDRACFGILGVQCEEIATDAL
jgi:hypothetical protein